MLKKGLIGGAVIIIGIVAGFIFLLRGCLAGYDERSAMAPALYFEKDGKAVVFTIIEYGKATSYSSGPKGTFKSMSTSYFIQANDAATGELISNKKIKHHSDIKFYPIKIMGGGNNKAWVFISELLAYDPFTLEKIADKETIETKNPLLKGKMPDEERYYKYDNFSNTIQITATDGLKYILSTATLTAKAIDEDGIAKSLTEAKIKVLMKQADELEKQYRENYDRYRAFNKLYSERKISPSAYFDSSKNFERLRDTIEKQKNAIQIEMNDLDNLKDADDDLQRHIENLAGSSTSYTNISTAVDTFNGKWYGLLNNEDLEKPETSFRYRSVYTETARNKLYTAGVSLKDSTRKAVELVVGEPVKLSDPIYLQGGFLLNRKTALPIHLKNDEGFIVCYKEKVGNNSNIILSRVDLMGDSKWSVNTKLPEFKDWIYTGNKLIILGNDNKEISSSDANLLMIIDLQTGKVVKHDYFTNKMRKE